MVLSTLQSLYVHGENRSRSRTGAAVCRGAFGDELRQSESSLDSRRRRFAALANPSPRWLQCSARSRRATGVLQAVATRGTNRNFQKLFVPFVTSGAVKNSG